MEIHSEMFSRPNARYRHVLSGEESLGSSRTVPTENISLKKKKRTIDQDGQEHSVNSLLPEIKHYVAK